MVKKLVRLYFLNLRYLVFKISIQLLSSALQVHVNQLTITFSCSPRVSEHHGEKRFDLRSTVQKIYHFGGGHVLAKKGADTLKFENKLIYVGVVKIF